MSNPLKILKELIDFIVYNDITDEAYDDGCVYINE